MKKIYEKVKNIRTRIIFTTIGSLLGPIVVFAAVNSLNGFGGNQTLTSDISNLSIISSSSAGTHKIKWNGTTGGELLFGDLQQDSNLVWNGFLGIGTSNPQERLDVGNGSIKANTMKVIDIEVADSSTGEDWLISGTAGLPNIPTGGLLFASGGSGKNVIFEDNDNQLVPTLYVKGSGSGGRMGILTISPDFEIDVVGDVHVTGELILGASTSYDIKSSSSTMFMGSSTKSGCIVMGDSDGDGVTYITANDGVLTASSTKPAVCQ